MRILHVTPYWAGAWAYGGIPRVAAAQVHELARAGHHVTVCATDACARETRFETQQIGADSNISVRVFRNRSNRLAYDWQCFTPVGMHAYLRDHAHEFDIAHLHACRNLPGAIAAHYLDRYGVPYVLAPNGTAPVIERRHLAKHVFDVIAGRRILNHAAAVLAVSQAERQQLLSLGVADERIRVVPNPVDLSEFAPAPERGRFRARAKLGEAPVVAFLGKITPRKRLDVIVRAFARLAPDTQLVLAGNDMGGLADVMAIARAAGVASRIHCPGLLEGRARLDLLADADVVVYPGEHEVFGLVALESLLAGTPVVVAGDSGCGEIVRRTGGGLIVPTADDGALADAVSDILAAREQWRVSAVAAAAHVREEFAAGNVAARLASVYEHVCDKAAIDASSQVGVSFVVPVRNGEPYLARTIASIQAQADGRPMEIIVVDDRSTAPVPPQPEGVRVLTGTGAGASAAMNLGIAAAMYPVICQIDQDVELHPNWMRRVVSTLMNDPKRAAVQGQFTVDPSAPLLSRLMALDLEQRYGGLTDTTHVCTGNTAFRAEALRATGGFDESLGYGNDVDMSQRLLAADWRMGHCRQARSTHHWRKGLRGYWRQQYGFGYGRLDAVARDRRRVAGDSVAPMLMMAHPLVLIFAVASLILGFRTAGTVALAALVMERAIAGCRAFVRFGDPVALLFPVVHLVRDTAWVAAIATWTARRLLGRRPRPSDSMAPRPPASRPVAAKHFIPRPAQIIGVLPAHNEAATIAAVLDDVRSCHPDLDLLVVDDGSTDGTMDIVARAGVRWLRLPERMGIGSAMRAGLRYARRLGYDAAIRLDADGQHRATDIEKVIAPIVDGRADVVLGSRFLAGSTGPAAPDRSIRAIQRALAVCLSMLTRGAVTDPTCGFSAYGPRAMRLLAEDHPTGYPEPEMRLLLSLHSLTVVEVPVEVRPRLGGRTSLTALRLAIAGARVLLAMLIVPLRRGAGGGDGA